MPDFSYNGHRLSYEEWGDGGRALVLIHGLLLNRRMFARLGPEMAEVGNRVIAIDLLGHGHSDRPPEMVHYSMDLFARQVVGLLDHLELEQAVVGGTSLGANVSLTAAARFPDRVRGMMVEMPVLDSALLAVAVIFTPVMLSLRVGAPLLKLAGAAARRVPRTNQLLDIGLDWIRQDPEPSLAVLEGLFLGTTAPHHDERVRIEHPALVIGHRRDPLHPFSDSGMLVEELPNSRLIEANSILEWRLSPKRLDLELARFLEEVWEGQPASETALSGA